ncbi:two-partner secretion domain-containing protein, partial [Pseudomonas aeruginosa]
MVRPDSQRGKRTSSKAGREGRFVLAASSTLMFAIASINAAMAAPTGAQFNPSEIKISQQGKTTLIDQSTQRAIINWKGFDVSADEAVRFNQPGVTSSTLNRVTAGQESVIAGRISAPGQVIIYNSNGVVFSGSAKVDVGSLITTTANISDEHFRQGKLIFDQPGNPDARIVNDGSISVAEKGLAAFVAPSVANNGVINARLGTVAMAAGGAGGQAGGSDAANLLKPALARGELRTIAATTWAEYKKYFEKDPALARRFQPVQLHEPSVAEAVTILRGLARVYEESHGIYLRDDAVVAAAELSARYLAGRQLPDKAVDVLDTACARVRISLAAAPESLERLRGELAEGERQRQALRRDAEAGLPIDHDTLQALEERLAQAESERHVQEDQWSRQRELAERLLALRQQLARAREANREEQGGEADAETFPADEHGGVEALEKALHETRQALADAQAQGRLVSFEVCPRLVAEVIGAWTGVPVEQLAREHNAKVMGFADDLRARIRGQEQAVSALDRAMRATAAGLNKPDAPVGVFLLVGPSGVGKTETALALADLL